MLSLKNIIKISLQFPRFMNILLPVAVQLWEKHIINMKRNYDLI